MSKETVLTSAPHALFQELRWDSCQQPSLVWPRHEEQHDAGLVKKASRARVEQGEADRASTGWKNV